jgi:hypothetical protein
VQRLRREVDDHLDRWRYGANYYRLRTVAQTSWQSDLDEKA